MRIDAAGMHYRQLNEMVRRAAEDGVDSVVIDNALGHRYIGAGLKSKMRIEINGTPGNDLGVFMDGVEVIVNGNAQDGTGNTMNDGKIVINGHAGDILGYAMRGGRIYVRGDVGYRAGIHMKAFRSRIPVVVVGGTVGDYAGEYMAGGAMLVLNLSGDERAGVTEYVGTGMHGGSIYLRGDVESWQVGAEVGIENLSEDDWALIESLIADFGESTGASIPSYDRGDFRRLFPQSARPYGTLYAY
jgi:glutamate synthase domain-containing protein 3